MAVLFTTAEATPIAKRYAIIPITLDLSIKELAETINVIAGIMDKDYVIELDKNRVRPENSEVERLFGDNSLIRELTNWEPKYSGIKGFKKGLEKTFEWYLNNQNYYSKLKKTDITKRLGQKY